MAEIVWSPNAKKSMASIGSYLAENYGEEYADRILDRMVSVVTELAKHPTKGMVIDRKRDLRRWRLDGHNYLTYTIAMDGIVVKNILPYRLNKKGF
jgi:plasmid stabilization system protein ParE